MKFSMHAINQAVKVKKIDVICPHLNINLFALERGTRTNALQNKMKTNWE